jgi:hypothetical protein
LATVQFGGMTHPIVAGEVALVPLGEGEDVEAQIEPIRGVDVGAGRGQTHSARLWGGVVGLVLDGRGRPLDLPADPGTRRAALMRWNRALDIYPEL